MENAPQSKSSEQGNKGIRNLLLMTSIATFLLIVLGYVVRITNSSQGCPDWPTCYGQFGLPFGLDAQIQYLHRVVAIIATTFILYTTTIAIWRYRSKHFITIPLITSTILILLEVITGSEIIRITSSLYLGFIHLGVALAILVLLIYATMFAFFDQKDPDKQLRITFNTPVKKFILVIFVGILALMVNGVLLINDPGSTSCTAWPFCAYSSIGSITQDWIAFLHGLLALAVTVMLVILFFSAWQRRRNQSLLLTATTATTILFLGQIFIGMIKVQRGFPIDLIGVHATITAALWASVIVLLFGAGFDNDSVIVLVKSKFRVRFIDFIKLTKPLIVSLLLVTTLAGMIIGGKQLPALSVLFWTIVGGAFAAGGSSAINQYIDRDLDKKMQRTAKRPVASGRLYPAEGLAFGVALCLISFFIFTGFVNLLSGILAFTGMVYYVLLYSILLKKMTVQNIVIGGGAGAIPPLVGWAAATNSLNIPSFLLFAIVFFWTPPHFWALALVRTKDYARAGIPMLPVVEGERKTRLQIFVYTLELVGLTLLLPLFKLGGSFYLVSAIALGGLLVYSAWKVFSKGGNKTAWMMYRYSSIYLALLFFAMVLDVLLKKAG